MCISINHSFIISLIMQLFPGNFRKNTLVLQQHVYQNLYCCNPVTQQHGWKLPILHFNNITRLY